MKVAAYQAPLLPAGSMEALDLIRARVEWCEAEDVTILCCPEAILGGLADHAHDPMQFAITADRLDSVLAPLASDTVTTIIGFTELAQGNRLYNSAAVLHRGSVAGVYRKLHPAINRSVYKAGHDTPVFQIDGLTFGIVICNDWNFAEPAAAIAARGATALFVPTNNGLPRMRASADLVDQTRSVDVARATENRMWIIRADVAGRSTKLASCGSSAIVHPNGVVMRSARQLEEDLLLVEVEV